MVRFQNPFRFLLPAVMGLTMVQSSQAVEIPPCPEGTERRFHPSIKRPVWASCKDPGGLYQGLLIQFSTQSEIIRIAAVKDSRRHGKEIRFGEPGTLEERTFKEGQLDGRGFVFASEAPLGRYFPRPATQQDWANFIEPGHESVLARWIGKEPKSGFAFKAGRLTELRFGSKIYRFSAGKEGRIHSLDHPEMKGGFFVDPEAMWELDANDLKAMLTPGFGSCKKYSGPIGRFTRHYDTLLFKKMPTEKKHMERLSEIRSRFIDFCVPRDLRENLGKIECPPLLPSSFPAKHCLLPVSDRIHNPYDPKYFKFAFSLGHSPEELALSLIKAGIWKFLSSDEEVEKILPMSDTASIRLKKTPDGLKFILMGKKEGQTSKEPWWEWHRIPGL